jgi:hypothetical protein
MVPKRPMIAGLPHEELSIATAMLAAGSACAIASLWPVRLYQELLVGRERPAGDAAGSTALATRSDRL